MAYKAPLNSSAFQHRPVLANEVLTSLGNLPIELLNEGVIIDATIGGGGHSRLILETFPGIEIIGLDQDPSARNAAHENLNSFKNRITIIETNFSDFIPQKKINAVIADLGVNSPQLDNAKRGFSFHKDGPLDMRMNSQEGLTAADIISKLDENELADVIYKYGEEKFSRRIAKKIKTDLKEKGSYSGTEALAYAIAGCYPKKMRYGRIHAATRTFQALRIYVNNELEALDSLLKEAPAWLKPKGIFAIISFHSLEDRQVKRSFSNDHRLNVITRKPIVPTEKEIVDNPRCRSAKFRVASRKEQVLN